MKKHRFLSWLEEKGHSKDKSKHGKKDYFEEFKKTCQKLNIKRFKKKSRDLIRKSKYSKLLTKPSLLNRF